jgi:glycosyltransferase involved in cell wall biosynthesis
MKVLLYCPLPFALAHGGQQIQIQCTQAALQSIGVEVEPVRWWDERQSGDIIHYFGRMPVPQIQLAHQKGMKVVQAELLTATGARSSWQLGLQRLITRLASRLLPAHFVAAFHWQAYRLADACIALTAWEAHLMRYLFGAPGERVHVVPLGVEEVFLNSAPTPRGLWLVCTATITERKRVLELAQAAVQAHTPLWVVGKPYAESDSYAQRFFSLARQHPQLLRYEGAIDDRAKLAQVYRQARGFVLLSAWETLSLSALEAAACGCPLLLSDLPWARSAFGNQARYCPVTNSVSATARVLKRFYDEAPTVPPPARPLSWTEVAQQLHSIYRRLLGARSGEGPGT